MYLVVYC